MIDLPEFNSVNLDSIITPCLAVSPKIIRENLTAMIAIAGSPGALRPHCKTHKCAEIIKIAASLGIVKHKCATLAEAEMLIPFAQEIFLAYPLIGPATQQFASLVQSAPNVQFATIVDNLLAAEQLAQALAAKKLSADVLLDLNVGMNRTGIQPAEAAFQLARAVGRLPALRLVGLHVYDGHNHQPSLNERTQSVDALMQPVLDLVRRLQEEHPTVSQLICGGTPTFPVFAAWAKRYQQNNPSCSVDLSPGTSVLSDFNYHRDYPDISGVHPAAVLFTRVISKPADDLVTVDLGHKAVAADPPAGKRCHFVDLPDAVEVKHSEEHLVVRTSIADQLQIGQVLRVLPAHICPTAALHAELVVVEQGKVTGTWPVTRHRIYRAS